jgi:hypothetical protein
MAAVAGAAGFPDIDPLVEESSGAEEHPANNTTMTRANTAVIPKNTFMQILFILFLAPFLRKYHCPG